MERQTKEQKMLTDKELIDSELLDDKATLFIDGCIQKIYKGLESAQIPYDEEMVSQLLVDGFKAGYAVCWREVKGTDAVPS